MLPETAIARVLRHGVAVGLAFAVGTRLVITCAHVVNTAMGRSRRDGSPPPAGSLVLLEFPFGGHRDEKAVRGATVVGWLPDGGAFELSDIAALQLTEDLPDGVPVLELAPVYVTGRVQMWGPAPDRRRPYGHVTGDLMGARDKGRLHVDQVVRTVFRVTHGFSGGPVWQPATGRVVGVVQESGVDGKDSDVYILRADLASELLMALRQRVVDGVSQSGSQDGHTGPALLVVGKPSELVILNIAGPAFGARSSVDPSAVSSDSHGRDMARGIVEDVALLSEQIGLTADVVIVAGDLANRGRPAEYEQAYQFLTELRNGLGLSEKRIIIVPGVGDVNYAKCASYFYARQGDDELPAPPYWPKWEPFAAMFSRFYGKEFPRDLPWSYSSIPSLKLAVAGINSTMAHSHLEESAYGWLGPEQVQWFADRMMDARKRGWLRVAVLHHSPVDDGERPPLLRDSADLVSGLAPYLNLAIHGAAAESSIQHLGPTALPVLGARRAGTPDLRLREGSYQLIAVQDGGMRVWQRRLDTNANVAEGTHATDGFESSWHELTTAPDDMLTHTIRDDHQRELSGPTDRRLDLADPNPDVPRDPGHNSAQDDLLYRVEEVARLRSPASHVTRVDSSLTRTPYLRVAAGNSDPDGRPTLSEQYPIGVCEGTATASDVERFQSEVESRYRTGGHSPGSKLIYHGPPAPAELVAWSARKGIELISFAEYQVGYDLRPYAARQADELARDPVYPPALYVPQRFTSIGTDGLALDDAPTQDDILERIRRWLSDPEGHLVVVLGAFGHGKTFLLHELARRMYTEGDPAIPVLVQMRDLEKAHHLDELVASQLTKGGERKIDLSMFRYLLREGRIALLFDGFEELALRGTYERAAEHLSTIIQAAEGRAKVVLTSRDQYFRNDADVASALGDRLARFSGRRLVKLADFDEAQIAMFLTNRLGNAEKARERLEDLRNVRDLLGLARNPRMLDFIARIDESRLRGARVLASGITAAMLYREILSQWLTHERSRLDRPGSLPVLSKRDLWVAVTDLALRLWQSSEPSLGLEDLSQSAEALVVLTRPDGSGGPGPWLDPNQAQQLLGAGTMLVRDSEGRFTFVHRSVMEWLVAKYVADRLNEGVQMPRPLLRPISPLMAEFVCTLAEPGVVATWAAAILTDGQTPSPVADNALLMQRRLGIVSVTLRLAGRDLRGQDLSERSLIGADLGKTDLAEARLVRTDLTGANLAAASLQRARLDGSLLVGAVLTGANLAGASLLGTDLRSATFQSANLRRVAMLGAQVSPDAFVGADTHGAALPVGRAVVRPQIRSRASAVLAISIDGRGGLLASGGTDSLVLLWDIRTGAPLRALSGHGEWVWSVAFSPDGTLLASAGGDRTVRLWDTGTGDAVRVLEGHTGVPRSVAFSPDGQLLASVGDDRIVRLWDVDTGNQTHAMKGHTDTAWSVTFAPDGTSLASAGSDGTVRLWSPMTGAPIMEVARHSGILRSVAFSPTGDRLAYAGGDRVVRIWDTRTGQPIGELAGHSDWVRCVAFSPDGRRVVSAGGDRIVRLWDASDGVCLHEFVGHQSYVRAVAFTPDGRQLVSAGDDQVLRVWDPATGASVLEMAGHTSVLRSVAFSPNGHHMASAGDDCAIRVWDTDTGRSIRELRGDTSVLRTLAFSPNGQQIASAGDDRIVRIWDQTTGNASRELAGHTATLRTIAFSPDSRSIASAGDDHVIKLWDQDATEPYLLIPGHTDAVWAVAFSPDGTLLASAGSDRVVRIYNLQTDIQMGTLTGHTGVLRSVAFSPDSQLIASAGSDRVVRVWRINGTLRHLLIGNTDTVWSVAFSPDGILIAGAGDDRIIRLWSAKTGSLVRELHGHTDTIWSIAFSPDGRWLASCGDDGTLRLWNTDSGKPRATLLPLVDGGWAALIDNVRYKLEGTSIGEFWYVVNMCRFEPGELDAYGCGVVRLPAGSTLPDPG